MQPAKWARRLSAVRKLMAPPPEKRRGIGFTADLDSKRMPTRRTAAMVGRAPTA
jgi:hypothetical protein